MSLRNITAIICRQWKYYPISVRYGDHMKFDIPSVLCSADGLSATFFKAPMPSGWTLIQAESRLTILTLIWIIPVCCSFKNAALQNAFSGPVVYTDIYTRQSSHSLGKLLHLFPFSTRYSTAFRTFRLLIFSALGNGSWFFHVASFNSIQLFYYFTYVNII